MDIKFLQIENKIVSIAGSGALHRIDVFSDRALVYIANGDNDDIISVLKDKPTYGNLMNWLYPQTLTLHVSREEWRIPAPEPTPEVSKSFIALDLASQITRDSEARQQIIVANPENADELQRALDQRRAQAREAAGPDFSVTTLNESKLIADVLDTLDIYQDAHPDCNCLRCVKMNEGIFQLQSALETHVQHVSEQGE